MAAVDADDDWERWEAELRDTSATEGTTFVGLVGSPSTGKTALLSRLWQSASLSAIDISARTVRDYGRGEKSAVADDLLVSYLSGHGTSWPRDDVDWRDAEFAECRRSHSWLTEANEQARRTPDDLAAALRFDQYERRTGWALIVDLHRRPADRSVEDRTSWVRIVDLLKFLLFCARKLVIHTPVGQDPEPSEPPGRLVASTGRPPRGPDCGQEPTDLFTAGELASV